MTRFLAIALLACVSSPGIAATAFDLEGVAPGNYSSLVVTDGPLTLTITPTSGTVMEVGNLSNPPLLGSVGIVGGSSPFVPLKWSFNSTVDAITFNFGDLGGDDDSPVLIQAYSAANVLLGSATTDYVANLATGKSLSLNFLGSSYFVTSSGSAQGNINSLVWDIGAITPGRASAVPEPGSWMMMAGGFGLIGAAMRRKKYALKTA